MNPRESEIVEVEKYLLKRNRSIVLYGELCESDYEDILEKMIYLNALSSKDPVYLYICSEGGETSAGLAVYDLMQWLPAPVYTIGMGICASMAAILLMAGKRRFIFPHSWVMLHQSQGLVYGDTDTTVSRANMMERQEKQFLHIQAYHTQKTVEQIERDTIKEKWFSAQDALEYRIVDEVIVCGMPNPPRV
jgi:ATP-dependent Clp protease protease subunit